MAPEQSVPSETQDQSIKSRKHQLFDAEAEIPVEQTRARSVEDYLRMTPAQPFEMGLKLGLGAAGAVVVLLLGVVLFTGHKSKVRAVDLGPPVGGALLAKNSQPSVAPPPSNSPKPDGSASSGDKEGKDDGDKPKEKSKKKGKGKNKKKKAEEEEEEKDEPAKPIDPAQWRVAVDAPEQTLEIPAGQEMSVAVPAGPEQEGQALFSSTPSPFVALGNNDVEGDAREVWDLRTKKRVGVIRGDLKAKAPFVLSPDGFFLAAQLDNEKKDKDKDKDKEHSIAIWSFKTGGEVKQIKAKGAVPDYIEFATIGLLVTGNLGDRHFEVWNIPKAESLGKFKVGGPIDKGSLALSPGRKYLAMSSLIDGRLRFFDLTTQEPCGEAALPKDLTGATCAGLAFASDGKELAGAYDAGGKLRIICWEAATGKIVADHAFDPKPGTFNRAADVGGETLEWLPDRSGWLLAGQAIVDRQTGRRIWSLPLDPYDFPPGPRKMVDSDRALIVWGQGRSKVVRTVALPKDKLASARKFVQANGSAVDAVLPAAKSADWSGLHTVAGPAASWSVKPEDDKVANPPKALLSRPIALKSRLDEVRRVFCSGGEASQAVVSSMAVDRDNFAGNVLNAGHKQSLDRFDLMNGKRLSSDDDLPVCSDAIALSSDGARVLFRDSEDGERLDLFGYSGTDLKHLAGWRPYEKETGDGRQVIWAAFLDATHALTVNATGTLVMWVVPDCRAYYSVKKACQGAPVLSQGRKVLAGLSEDSIRFFDPATGQEIGKTAAPSVEGGGKPGTFAGAFRRDCQQLTMVLGGSLLARVDMKTGKVISEFRSPVVPAYELTWCGNRHVLINNWSLIDLDKQLEVWRYEAGVPAPRSPDGRFWSAVEPFPGQPAALAGFVIPDKSVDKLVAVVQDKNTKALLRAGVPVSLQIDINSDSKDADKLREELFTKFANQLKANEIPLQPRQAVTLVIRLAEVDSGELSPAAAFAPALEKTEDGKKPVSLRNLECEVLLVDSTGKASLEPKQVIQWRTAGPIKMSPTDKDVDRYLRRRLYNEARARLARVVIPPFAARAADGLAKFPGFTHLGQATR